MTALLRRVIVETPYSGWSWPHVSYAQACMDHCITRGEAPMIGYLLYPPRYGPPGVDAALAWESVCEALVVYLDLGMWHNMRQAILRALAGTRPIELRVLDANNQPNADRIRQALRGRPMEVAPDACRHQLDTAVLDSRVPGRVLSWRCACGAAGPNEEQVKAAIGEASGR